MDMVERVARHIFSANTGTEHYEAHHPAFEHEQKHWEVLARAAIEAMREKTAAMSEAMRMANMNIAGGYGGPDGWEAGIDAALKEHQEGKAG